MANARLWMQVQGQEAYTGVDAERGGNTSRKRSKTANTERSNGTAKACVQEARENHRETSERNGKKGERRQKDEEAHQGQACTGSKRKEQEKGAKKWKEKGQRRMEGEHREGRDVTRQVGGDADYMPGAPKRRYVTGNRINDRCEEE